MRVRMIRPAYWTDADLHMKLTADQREFYIGLWMLADDAGYVVWDPDRIGAELYPYRDPQGRGELVLSWAGALGHHVQVLACGKHLLVPNLAHYQSPPKPVYTNQRAHDKCLRDQVAPAASSGVQLDPAREGKGVLKEGKGREGKGTRAPAREAQGTNGESEFRAKLAAEGYEPGR